MILFFTVAIVVAALLAWGAGYDQAILDITQHMEDIERDAKR